MRLRRSDSSPHLLVRRSAVRVRSHLLRSGRMHDLHGLGTSGVVEPAASFVAQVADHARTIYVGPEEPANASAFTECHLGKAGEALPNLFGSL
jgi:NAD-dependent SIR2 family protein deacetylase